MSPHRLILLAALSSLGTALPAAPRLDPMFSSQAVLQRDRPIRISGEAAPGEELRITFAGLTADAIADRDGRWQVELPPVPAGGPHRLRVSSALGAVEADDILVGDVWLCSGQSNMEWSILQSLNGQAEAQASNDPEVRLLSVPQKNALEVQSRFDEPPRWAKLDPKSAGDFSAACTFMIRHLRASARVPIGAIDASWGGTRIRPWIDEATARASGGEGDAELLAVYRRDPAAAARRFGEIWGAWWRGRTGQAPGMEPWRASERLQWKAFPAIGPWEQWGDPAFASFNGHVWARRKVRLTPEQARLGATLSLGVIDDLDQSFVNGVGVGSMFSWSTPRDYRIAPGILRAGENEILVNIGDSWGAGGFQGPADKLKLTFSDGTMLPLADGWNYAVVPPQLGSPPRAPWDTHAGLGTIYNAMIAPLGPVGLAGVAWYQGESDVGVPGYDRRLAALMSSWRRQFRNPELPFLVVTLAGFGKPTSVPVDSGWAALIDEQRRAVAADPKAALVVATDLGEQADIHPPNKQEVGRRLALAARRLVHGDASAATSPLPLEAKRAAGGIEVRFDRPLRALGDMRPIGFELCAETQESCRWASARIDGPSVLLSGDGRAVTRVRYGWSDFPLLNLVGADDLPAPPFELPLR